MRVALAQIDPTVGDIDGNVERVLDAARRASAAGARIVVLPELAITGYPPRDLLERPRFVDDNLAALRRVAEGAPADVVLLVGFVDRANVQVGRRLHNAVAAIAGGGVMQVVHKRLLPTYDVFDEDRYFEPGERSEPIEVDGVRIGVTICEDIWNDVDVEIRARRYEDNPIADLRAAGAGLIVNLAASPFTLAKRVARSEMLAGVARNNEVPIVFVNQVGGNDDLLFDGASAIYGPDGAIWARAASWSEDLVVAEVAPGGEVKPEPPTDEAAALEAITLGVRDYARKCGFRRAVLGLSGGIDSALTAVIAARALGPENVLAVAMPTRYSSKGSLTDSEALVGALGIEYRVIGIDDVFQSYIDEIGPHLEALGPPPANDVTFENIQARIRCAVLMAISNRFGSLLLTTGNKSEIAVGYSTLYGDMAGGLAVISDLPKTFVYRVAREVNREAGREIIPSAILTKAPSAELRDNQTDQDSLPPYEALDPILELYVEDGCSIDDIVARGHDEATVRRVVRMVRVNEYKRRQMPPGLIVTKKAFGPGRRYPIAQRYDR